MDNSPMVKKVVDTASNFIKSPNNLGSSSQNQKTVSNFAEQLGAGNVEKFTTGRDRLNSAFQKYDPKADKDD